MKKTIAGLVVLMLTACAYTAPPKKEFFSWYNGYSSHKVWGLGIVTGPYLSAFAPCGTAKIEVKPIYDVHTATNAPTTEETAETARAHNVALMEELKRQRIGCAFEADLYGDSVWLNRTARK
jgi:hypothetical protein